MDTINRQHTNVADFLLDGKEPSRLALQLSNDQCNYGDLRSMVMSISRYLLELVVEKGQRVILASDNSPFWVAAYLATLRSGLVSVPLPTDVSLQDFEHILQVTGARILFAKTAFALRNRELLQNIHLVTDHRMPSLPVAASWKSFADLRSDTQNAQHGLPIVCPEDLAALMFTSGSTGKPRGVMVSHANIMANTESIIQYLALTGFDRIMTVLPFHYCFGTSLLHTHLRVGGSLVICILKQYFDGCKIQSAQDSLAYPPTFRYSCEDPACERITFLTCGMFSRQAGTWPPSLFVSCAGHCPTPRFL